MQAINDTSVQECDATGDAIKRYSRTHKKIFLLFIIICFTVIANAQYNITLTFKNTVGEKQLNTDSSYTNQSGETFTVRNFRYYISNITFTDSVDNRLQSYSDEYFLIDEKEEASKQVSLSTSLKHITGIEFLLGVDSIKNVSGVQAGSLDPARGMFWTWNSGYVMAKLEGNSPVANTPMHAFSYHIGGYKTNENAARKIRLSTFVITAALENISITADILKWFAGMHTIKIADIAFCHEPGKPAMQFADNYANMFSIEVVK
ncbi:hypothetical protein FRZ67_01575 [Panacibacter ginsenosidivorans]|uniref:Copper-binding protein MbnP-like domain-containing protein n=1 Tax=Panacibacter ginsenosidivorans TaxID=1813871 RepID=A0A5B8V3F9_9BACT|nr:MbnP family protein [Panacibacter ginsenosidivorans]QEC66057.1 hypothetical protein FRZ67_01575 [Panacibacter ginsenosidivorans]